MTSHWTVPGDVIDRARTMWNRGGPLSAVASGLAFPPLQIPVKGPAPTERSAKFDEVRRWLQAWRAAPAPLRVDWRTVNDRVVGKVETPTVAWLDTVDDVARAIGKTKELAAFTAMVETTPDECRPYMARRPLRVLAIGTDWPAVVAAAQWLSANPASGLHARQIPASGVHTKIVETYRRDIAELNPAMGESADASGKGWFAARYGLASKSLRIRFRYLDPSLDGVPQFSDVEIPVEEAARFPVAASTVLIVENDVSFLALPPLPGVVAVYGGGRAASALVQAVPWLASEKIAYWGDIDTWGLVILDEVRAVASCPVTGVLMDEPTLLAHRNAWAVETTQATSDVAFLEAAEATLFRDLKSQKWGPAVRLEQERLPWPTVVESLARINPA